MRLIAKWFMSTSRWRGQLVHAACTKSARMTHVRQHMYVYTHKRVNLVQPLYLCASTHANRVAIVDQHATHTYSSLLQRSSLLADRLDIDNCHVALLCDNDVSYVIAMFAVWMRGGVVVPLSAASPPSRLADCVLDARCSVVIAASTHEEHARCITESTHARLLLLQPEDYLVERGVDEHDAEGIERRKQHWNRLIQLHQANKFRNAPALIVYTSGTTGPPKGVVHTHGGLQAQMEAISTSWSITNTDVLLHVLPLHHIHGIVNALMTPLYTGATCVMMPRFDAAKVWKMLMGSIGCQLPRPINLFMAVPTIYSKLIEHQRHLVKGRRSRRASDYIRAVCSSKIRLMVSGSASLPESVMRKWEELTGHRLLERYGMSEVGMVLGNPLHGERVPGCVGWPFPSVEVLIARKNVYSDVGYDVLAQGNSRRTLVTAGCEGQSGELYVRGPSVFLEYWQQPQATHDAFTPNGWFKTGDTVSYSEREGYRILGRTSVDIIKSGGYKISALDVERHLLAHPSIVEVVVVGLPDITWGQRVAAVVVLDSGAATLQLAELQRWSADHIAHYSIPTVLKVVDCIPRNALGKVNKKQLLHTLFPKEMKQTV